MKTSIIIANNGDIITNNGTVIANNGDITTNNGIVVTINDVINAAINAAFWRGRAILEAISLETGMDTTADELVVGSDDLFGVDPEELEEVVKTSVTEADLATMEVVKAKNELKEANDFLEACRFEEIIEAEKERKEAKNNLIKAERKLRKIEAKLLLKKERELHKAEEAEWAYLDLEASLEGFRYRT